jgi:hypothetical protein
MTLLRSDQLVRIGTLVEEFAKLNEVDEVFIGKVVLEDEDGAGIGTIEYNTDFEGFMYNTKEV